MLRRLRAATAEAHQDLESRLDLLAEPLSSARFRDALIRFESFHRAWEPQVAALVDDETFLAPRRRRDLLLADIAALGGTPQGDVAPDLAWLSDAGAAWGSLYVMEGSTLGGQVIARALRQAAWLPAGGLRYFSARGERTGPLWRELTARLEAQPEPAAVVAGAIATFRTLADWVAPRPSPAD